MKGNIFGMNESGWMLDLFGKGLAKILIYLSHCEFYIDPNERSPQSSDNFFLQLLGQKLRTYAMSSHSTRTMSSVRTNCSGTTKSTVTRAAPTNTVVLRREQAYGAFKRLQDYMKEISAFETEYADFDKVIHDRDAVINDLHAIKDKFGKRERDIDLLRSCRKLDLEEFLVKTDNLKEEICQMVKKHSSEKKQAENDLHLHQTKIASMSTELERAKDEIRLTKAQLEASNQELAQWRAPLSHLRPLDARDL